MSMPAPPHPPEPGPEPGSMSAAEVAAVVAEAGPLVVGGVVVRVRQPWPQHLAFEVRKGGRNVELLVGVAADLARVHLAVDLPPSPPRALPFTLRVRKAMRPGRVVALEAVPGERIVTLAVSRRRADDRPDADRPDAALVAELFGRGRMFLLEGTGRVVAAEGPGGTRGLAPGAPYAPPPPPRAGRARAPGPEVPAAGISAALEARYREALAGRAQRREAAAGAARLAAARRRITRRILAMERDLAACAAAPVLRREAELLAAHRHLLEPGMAEVRVTDWFEDGAPERVIALDPALPPGVQVDLRFARAREAERGAGVLAERLERARAALARLDAVGEAAAPVEAAPPEGRGRSDGRDFRGVRRFRPEGGWEIWVGRGPLENDRLTFRLARPGDLWLHARGASGAHVVLRAPGGRGAPPERAVREAALFAAHFSRLKAAGGGEVTCTERRHVRRAGAGGGGRGAAPGRVTVTRERVIEVRLDAEAVARLLASRVR